MPRLFSGFLCFLLYSYEFSFAHDITALETAAPTITPIYEKPIITYTDFVSISLTVVTVFLALMGIGLGVLAFFTLKDIKQSASDAADAALVERLRGIDQMVRDRVNEVLFEEGLPSPPLDPSSGNHSQNHNI